MASSVAEQNPPPAPPPVSELLPETNPVPAQPETTPVILVEAHEETQDSGQGAPDWPPQVHNNKVFMSYFEREEDDEADNNDR